MAQTNYFSAVSIVICTNGCHWRLQTSSLNRYLIIELKLNKLHSLTPFLVSYVNVCYKPEYLLLRVLYYNVLTQFPLE